MAPFDGATLRRINLRGAYGNNNTNQLEYVTDGGTSGNYDDDLETQGSGNYTYSAIGELEHDASEGIDLITWDINGKIHSIQRTPGWSIPGSSPTAYPSDLEFKYDAMGNRICKIEKPRDYAGILNEDTWIYTYYVRDASGNVMAVYTRDLYQAGSNYTDEMRIKETHVYGGSRLGIRDYTAQAGITASVTYAFSGYVSSGDDDNGKFNSGAQVSNTAMPHPSATAQTRTRGRKVYELSNHLGNVLVTFYDRKISKDGNADNITDYYLADVNTTSDYSAFGSPLPGRTANANDYRYGFNDKENDPETETQDYGMRIYNPALGRFLSQDPLTKNFPMLTPYQFASNRPISAIDLDGMEAQDVNGPPCPPDNNYAPNYQGNPYGAPTWTGDLPSSAMPVSDPNIMPNVQSSGSYSNVDLANGQRWDYYWVPGTTTDANGNTTQSDCGEYYKVSYHVGGYETVQTDAGTGHYGPDPMQPAYQQSDTRQFCYSPGVADPSTGGDGAAWETFVPILNASSQMASGGATYDTYDYQIQYNVPVGTSSDVVNSIYGTANAYLNSLYNRTGNNIQLVPGQSNLPYNSCTFGGGTGFEYTATWTYMYQPYTWIWDSPPVYEQQPIWVLNP